MSRIEQIYATHCTFGTSAIERRDGEMAERVLGYSARASSLSQTDLRKHFRTFERYLSYALPSDTPSELRLTRDAHSSPKRLVFLPSVSGFQLLGQIAYRTWDTTGKRPGSYFGHLLVQERAKDDPPWNILDCLQLWGAPGWHVEDSAALTYELDPLAHVKQLGEASFGVPLGDTFYPAVNDEVFLNFLTRDDVPQFGSPLPGFIPERWQAMPAAQRRELFLTALRGYLEIADRQRDNVVLIVEPEMSVLFYYGIARLLPDGELRQSMSFSTFEATVDRPSTLLAATHFYDPARGDVRPDRYQRGFVLHTFLEGKSTPIRQPHAYADLIVGALVTQGWRAVEDMFAAFQAGQGKTVKDLGELVRAREIGHKFLDTSTPLDLADWDKSDFVKRYVGKALSTALADPPRDEILARLASAPDRRSHVILRLLSGGQHAGACDNGLRRLAELLPEDQILAYLEMAEVPVERKVKLLARFAVNAKRLPRQCEGVFDAALSTAKTGQDMQLRPLATPLLRALPSDTLRELVDRVSKDHQAALFVCLAEAFGPQEDNQKWLRRLALSMHFEPLSIALERLGDRTDVLAPETKRELGLRFVQQVLNPIYHTPAEFQQQVVWLKRARRIIAELEESQRPRQGQAPTWAPIDRTDAWCEIPEIIRQARAAEGDQRRGRGSLAGDPRAQAGKRLADALSRAWPHNEIGGQVTAMDKAVSLYNILATLQATDLVSPEWKRLAANYLEYGQWFDSTAPTSIAAAERKKFIYMGVGAGVVTVLVVLLLLLSRESNQVARDRQDDPSTVKPAPSPKPTPKPVTPTPKPETKPAGGPPVTPPPTSEKPSEKPAGKAAEGKPPMDKPSEDKPSEDKPPMDKPPDAKPPDAKPMAEKPMPMPPPGDKPEGQPAGKPAEKDAKPAEKPMEKPAQKPADKPADKSKDKPAVPVDPKPEDPPEPVERAYEIAQLPAPPPGEFPFWGSPSDPSAQYKMGGELKLEWEVWSNPQKRRINVDKFELHGFSLAMEPWRPTTGKSDPAQPPMDVTIAKITPGVHAVRVTGQDGLPVELARFQIPRASGKLLLTMDLKTRSFPSHFEIQKQILFCVVELTEDDGTRFFFALQPQIPAKKIVMSRDEIQAGNIRSKTDLGGVVPCPMSTSLQRLSIARGVLTFKDMRRYIFGQGKWEDATSASEWPLKPVESAPPLENFRAVVAESGRVFSLTMAATATKDADLEASIARCEKEIKDIMDARGKVSRGKKARVDNDRAKYLSEGAAQLCKLLKIEPKKLPTPFSLKGDAKPDDIQAERARVQADWRDYQEWAEKTVDAADQRQKKVQAELDGLKKKRGELLKEGSTAAEEVRAQLDYALVELYREVPLNDGQGKVRVPVMLPPD